MVASQLSFSTRAVYGTHGQNRGQGRPRHGGRYNTFSSRCCHRSIDVLVPGFAARPVASFAELTAAACPVPVTCLARAVGRATRRANRIGMPEFAARGRDARARCHLPHPAAQAFGGGAPASLDSVCCWRPRGSRPRPRTCHAALLPRRHGPRAAGMPRACRAASAVALPRSAPAWPWATAAALPLRRASCSHASTWGRAPVTDPESAQR